MILLGLFLMFGSGSCAGEFGSVATLAVQKGATDLTSIIGGAVNTAVSLRGHRDNNLDTPFIPVPGLQRRKTTPMATLSAAISEISTVQGFLQAVLEEKIALGLEIVRVSACGHVLSLSLHRSFSPVMLYVLGKLEGFASEGLYLRSVLGAHSGERVP